MSFVTTALLLASVLANGAETRRLVPPHGVDMGQFSQEELLALLDVARVAEAVSFRFPQAASSTPLNAGQVTSMLTPVGTSAADSVDLCHYSFTREDRWGGGCAGACYFGRVACRVAVAAAFAGLSSVEAGVTSALIEIAVCQNLDRLCEEHCSGSIRQKMRQGYEFALCHENVSPAACRDGANDWVQVVRVIPRWMRSTHHELRHHHANSRTPGRVHELRLGFDYTDADGSQMRKDGQDWVCLEDSSRAGRRRRVPAGLELLAEPVEEESL